MMVDGRLILLPFIDGRHSGLCGTPAGVLTRVVVVTVQRTG